VYRAHIQEWRTQFHPLKSVDLRYQHQVIVNPDEVSGAPAPAGAQAGGEPAAPVPGVSSKTSKAGHHGAKNRN